MAKLVFTEEARWMQRPLMSSVLSADTVRLVETVLALWPIVEAVAELCCMLSDGDPGYECGECLICKARKLVR